MRRIYKYLYYEDLYGRQNFLNLIRPRLIYLHRTVLDAFINTQYKNNENITEIQP